MVRIWGCKSTSFHRNHQWRSSRRRPRHNSHRTIASPAEFGTFTNGGNFAAATLIVDFTSEPTTKKHITRVSRSISCGKHPSWDHNRENLAGYKHADFSGGRMDNLDISRRFPVMGKSVARWNRIKCGVSIPDRVLPVDFYSNTNQNPLKGCSIGHVGYVLLPPLRQGLTRPPKIQGIPSSKAFSC